MKSENEESDGDGDNLGKTINPYEREFSLFSLAHMDRNLKRTKIGIMCFSYQISQDTIF